MKSFFSEKRKISNKITLVDNKENTIFEDHFVSEELNKCFENATKGLPINENSYIIDMRATKLATKPNQSKKGYHVKVFP